MNILNCRVETVNQLILIVHCHPTTYPHTQGRSPAAPGISVTAHKQRAVTVLELVRDKLFIAQRIVTRSSSATAASAAPAANKTIISTRNGAAHVSWSIKKSAALYSSIMIFLRGTGHLITTGRRLGSAKARLEVIARQNAARHMAAGRLWLIYSVQRGPNLQYWSHT